MKKKLEKDSEKLLREEIKKLGGLCYKFISPGNAGVPDRIIILYGWVFFVEMKRTKGVLDPHQKNQIQKLKSRDQLVTVVYGDSGVRNFIKYLQSHDYIDADVPEEFR